MDTTMDERQARYARWKQAQRLVVEVARELGIPALKEVLENEEAERAAFEESLRDPPVEIREAA